VVREYIYSLGVGTEDDAEVIAWHWHPRVENQPEPYVYVRAMHDDVPGLARLHIPTSRIFLQDVLLFAVDNLGARTREGGRDGLVRARDRIRRWATWGTAPRSQELG
jgi:hypothetical protein